MVPEDGLEPSLLSETDFESVASTNFTTRAEWERLYLCITHKQALLLVKDASAQKAINPILDTPE